MTGKVQKTRQQLIEMLMTEVRRHPECDHVVDVAILRPVDRSWDAAWTVEGNEIVCMHAFATARSMQAKFDLVPH